MQEVISRWTETAPYWEKHRDVIREMFAPVTQALMEAAEITRRSMVLDVATGPGEPALSIAERIGIEGKVLGVDAVPEMVEAARREAHRRSLRHVNFAVAQADVLPAQTNTFDAVVSRFGIMFFPSPGGAVREMLRVLRPGGRIALAVWRSAENNPFHYTLSRIIAKYIDSPPPQPGAPDAFRFAETGKLQNLVREAGAANVSERLLQFSIRASVSAEEFWTLRSEMSENLRSKLAKLSKDQIVLVRQEAIKSLGAFRDATGVSLPAEVLIVTAAKPS